MIFSFRLVPNVKKIYNYNKELTAFQHINNQLTQ